MEQPETPVNKQARQCQRDQGGAPLKARQNENSLLVQKQSGEQPHFGQLSPEELDLVIQWITSGAPEK